MPARVASEFPIAEDSRRFRRILFDDETMDDFRASCLARESNPETKEKTHAVHDPDQVERADGGR